LLSQVFIILTAIAHQNFSATFNSQQPTVNSQLPTDNWSKSWDTSPVISLTAFC